jgi:hypothetical protein
MRLKFHECGWWHEPVDHNGPPSDFGQRFVHLINMRDSFDADARFLETFKKGRMRMWSKEIQVPMHHIAPDGMVLRGVLVVMLPHHKLA